MTSPPIRWVYQWPPETASPEFRLGRAGDEIVAEWVGLGVLLASLDGTRRDLRAVGSVDASEVDAVLGRHVAALLRHLDGGVSLHASSVACGGVAVAFLGASCAGKSTLASQLCERPDVQLISDDTAALEFNAAHVAIVPSETDHSLRPDVALAFGLDPGADRKLKKRALRVAPAPVRLGACVALVFDDSARLPVLKRLPGVEAFLALSLSTVRFVLDDENLLQRELGHLARVAEQAPVYELRRSRDLSTMHASARVAEHLLRSLSGGDAGWQR